MHKMNLHVMAPEEAQVPTPCAEDPELWFPDEQKPNAYAVAACWSCHFQAGCARRALANPMPEHGVWGGYRLAPGPGLDVTRAQLEIIAGNSIGPAMAPSAAVSAALADLADLPEQPVEVLHRGTVDWWSRREQRTAAGRPDQFGEITPTTFDAAAAVVGLDEWREPTAAELDDAAAELATLEFPQASDFLTDGNGQILLDLGWDAPVAAPRQRQPVLTGYTTSTPTRRRAS